MSSVEVFIDPNLFVGVSGENSEVRDVLPKETNLRENASIGQPVNLWLCLRDKFNQQPVQPYFVDTVRIYQGKPNDLNLDGSSNQPMETITPTTIAVGAFLVTWTPPTGLKPGLYTDLWRVQLDKDGPFLEISQSINVQPPTVALNSLTTGFNDLKFSLVTKELQRNARFLIEFVLVEPENVPFPVSELRIFNIRHETDDYFPMTESGRRAQVILDTSNFVPGLYLTQLRCRWGNGVYKTRTFGMRLEEQHTVNLRGGPTVIKETP